MNLDELKKQLCRGKFSQLSISWNDCAGAYNSVADEIEGNGENYPDDSFISLEDKARCIENNSLWTAHWYPDTPIGSYTVHASTFAALYGYLENFQD